MHAPRPRTRPYAVIVPDQTTTTFTDTGLTAKTFYWYRAIPLQDAPNFIEGSRSEVEGAPARGGNRGTVNAAQGLGRPLGPLHLCKRSPL